MTTAIFVLRPLASSGNYDDKSDDLLHFVDGTSLLGRLNIYFDFLRSPDRSNVPHISRLAEVWRPRKVIGQVPPEKQDYPTVGYSIPAFSYRAVEGLRDILEANGELLPLETPEGAGQYWAYNLLTVVTNALDEDRSSLRLYPNSTFSASKVLHHEFHSDRLNGLTMFRTRNTMDIYVTDMFVRRVQGLGLRGFNFLKVWPVPSGMDWERPTKNNYSMKDKKAAPKTAADNEISRMPSLPSCAAPKFHSRPFSVEELKGLADALDEFQQDCGLDAKTAPMEQIQAHIDKEVVHAQSFTGRDADFLLDRAFLLAIAWGQTVVRELGWQWKILVANSNNEETPAVVSPDESLAVPALLFLRRLVMNKDADPTTWLTFNMLKAGRFTGEPGMLKLVK